MLEEKGIVLTHHFQGTNWHIITMQIFKYWCVDTVGWFWRFL